MSLGSMPKFFSKNWGDPPVWRFWNEILITCALYLNFFANLGRDLVKELKLSLL